MHISLQEESISCTVHNQAYWERKDLNFLVIAPHFRVSFAVASQTMNQRGEKWIGYIVYLVKELLCNIPCYWSDLTGSSASELYHARYLMNQWGFCVATMYPVVNPRMSPGTKTMAAAVQLSTLPSSGSGSCNCSPQRSLSGRPQSQWKLPAWCKTN